MQQIFALLLDTTKLERWNGAEAILNALNLRAKEAEIAAHPAGAEIPSALQVGRDATAPLPLAGYRQLWQVSLNDGRFSSWSPHWFGGVCIGLEEGVLKFSFPNDPKPQPISLPKAIYAAGADSFDLSADSMTAEFARGPQSYRLVFDRVSFIRSPEGPRINNCSFLLFEK